MLLTGGIFRLLKQSISQEELCEAHTYLKLFAAQAPVFYGKNCTFNAMLTDFFLRNQSFQSFKPQITGNYALAIAYYHIIIS